MTAKYSTWFMALIICFVIITPCRLFAEEDAKPLVVSGEVRGAFDQAPRNVQLVIKALIAALRGEVQPDRFGPVLFQGDILVRLHKAEGVFYRGFDVNSIQISYIHRQPDGTFQFIGRIIWEDQNRRRAATSFSILFKTTPNYILVKDAAVARMPPNSPRLLVFLVPEKDVKDQLKKAKNGYLSLLETVSAKAVQLTDSVSLPRGKHDFLVFAFSLDRLAPGERLDFIIGDGDFKTDRRPKYQKLINYSGWPVLVLAATFDLRETKPPLYRVFYTPSEDHPLLEPKPYPVFEFTLAAKK
jgi:hypothetical protein